MGYTAGQEGGFAGLLLVIVDFQHFAEAVHRFLRRGDLHLPGRGEYPAVEIAAGINCFHAEMVLVHDLRRNVLPEAVDDAVHEDVFTQQRDPTRPAGEHGKLLCKICRHVKIHRLLHGGFLRDLQTVNAVNAKLCNLLPVIVEADEVVGIVIPEQDIWRDGIDLPAIPMNALFGGRVIEVAKCDLFSLRDSSLDSVYADVDALVDGFYTAVYVQMPFQQCSVAWGDKGCQPFDQFSALIWGNETGRLHRVDQQLDLRRFKMAGGHMVEVLHPAVFYNIHTELY